MFTPAPRRIPILIVLLFAADLILAIAPVLDYWAGTPFPRVSNLLNLDSESTLPTWYSSMQWCCAGALFALFAMHAWRSRMRGMLCVVALSLACLAFSVDEIAQIHERLGFASDALLSGGSRHGTALRNTGLWPFLIGAPVLAMLAMVVRGMRHIFLARTPRALWQLVAGLLVMFTGALLIELGANLIDPARGHGGFALAQVVLEELMEMLGVTFITWSAYSLLEAYGFELRTPPHAPARRAQEAARRSDSLTPIASFKFTAGVNSEAGVPAQAYTPAPRP